MGVPVTAAIILPATAAAAEPLPPMNHDCRASGVPIRLLAPAAVAAAPAAADLAPLAHLADAVDAAIALYRRELDTIEAVEAKPRPHGREHGLEWAYEQRLIEDGRLRQIAALLRALGPHEAVVRALAGQPA